jgi:hypothetical protein
MHNLRSAGLLNSMQAANAAYRYQLLHMFLGKMSTAQCSDSLVCNFFCSAKIELGASSQDYMHAIPEPSMQGFRVCFFSNGITMLLSDRSEIVVEFWVNFRYLLQTVKTCVHALCFSPETGLSACLSANQSLPWTISMITSHA